MVIMHSPIAIAYNNQRQLHQMGSCLSVYHKQLSGESNKNNHFKGMRALKIIIPLI